MQLKHTDSVISDEERSESTEKVKKVTPPGHKLVLLSSALIAAGLMGYGLYSYVKPKKAAVVAAKPSDAKTQVVPKLNVPLNYTPPSADAAASGVQVDGVCANGQRLPPGMPCPDSPRAASPAASSASQAQANNNGKPSPAEEERKRRFAGDLAVAATGGGATGGDRRPAATMTNPGGAGTGGGQAVTGAGAPGGLGDKLNVSVAPATVAKYKVNQSLTLSRGTLPDCTLLTAIKTGQPGFIRCVLSLPVYSMNGEVVLLEAGTTMNGEYTSAPLNGATSIFAVWVDATTEKGVTINLQSPSTDALGRAGASGEVDHKYFQRFAGAIFYSIFDDVLNIELAKAARPEGGGNTVTSYPASTGTGKSIVEEMLKQGGNAKPELYKNQGEVVRIFVARDVDFSTVYRLESTE